MNENKVIVLLGEIKSGKTTLFNILTGKKIINGFYESTNKVYKYATNKE